MTEEFLHYVWKTRQLTEGNLKTVTGEPLEIIHQGILNTDAGPDFFNARIRIGNTLWAGNIEIHTRASDWLRHGHQQDEAYSNIILHIVYEADIVLLDHNKRPYPTLVLKGCMDESLYARYLKFKNSKLWVACEKQLPNIEPIIKTGWMSRLFPERLEAKIYRIREELEQNQNDWELVFYRHLLRTLGMKVNAEAFNWLANSVPWQYLARKSDQLLQLEAVLLGQAGLLPQKPMDRYCKRLQQEYHAVQALYHLHPQPGYNWKHFRMRPANFPTVRIVQLAALIHKSPRLFMQLMETEHLSRVSELLEAEPSAYWTNHHHPDINSSPSVKRIGASTIHVLIINVVIPFLFLWGRQNRLQACMDRAIDWLEKLPAESNSILQRWQQHGVQPESAADGQALLHLYKNYCTKKQCLKCNLGRHILEAEKEGSRFKTKRKEPLKVCA